MVKRFEARLDRTLTFFSTFQGGFTLSLVFLTGLFGYYRRLDPDLFARLAVGKLVSTLGYLPHIDPFAFTDKKPVWIDHEWLSGVFLYWIWDLGEEAALLWARITLGVLSIFFLFKAHRKASIYPLPLLFLISVVQISAVWLSPIRSQWATYLSLSIILYVFALYLEKRKPALLFLISFLFPVWANAHGGFVVGLGFIGLFAVGLFFERVSSALPVFGACALALALTGLNPYGFSTYWSYILEASTMARPEIDEWSLVVPWSPYAIFPLFLTLLAIRGIVANKGIIRAPSYLVLVFSFYFGFRHHRLMPIYVMSLITLGAPALCAGITSFSPNIVKTVARASTCAVLLFTPILLVGALRGITLSPPFNYEGYPVEALRKLSENTRGGNLLIHFNYGSYAMWALPARFKISMDGRYEELYTDAVIKQVHDALTPRSLTAINSRALINPDFVLIETPTVKHAPEYRAGWRVLHEDALFTLLAKT